MPAVPKQANEPAMHRSDKTVDRFRTRWLAGEPSDNTVVEQLANHSALRRSWPASPRLGQLEEQVNMSISWLPCC